MRMQNRSRGYYLSTNCSNPGGNIRSLSSSPRSLALPAGRAAASESHTPVIAEDFNQPNSAPCTERRGKSIRGQYANGG